MRYICTQLLLRMKAFSCKSSSTMSIWFWVPQHRNLLTCFLTCVKKCKDLERREREWISNMIHFIPPCFVPILCFVFNELTFHAKEVIRVHYILMNFSFYVFDKLIMIIYFVMFNILLSKWFFFIYLNW